MQAKHSDINSRNLHWTIQKFGAELSFTLIWLHAKCRKHQQQPAGMNFGLTTKPIETNKTTICNMRIHGQV